MKDLRAYIESIKTRSARLAWHREALLKRTRLADALEAPWGLRIEKRLREVFTPETANGAESTRKIAEVVRELGLQPWKAPEPLDPITEDEIHVVVWMGVVAKGE